MSAAACIAASSSPWLTAYPPRLLPRLQSIPARQCSGHAADITLPIATTAALGRAVYSRLRRCARERQQSEELGASVRVVTYNVLMPDLCSARRFPHCKAEDLEEERRWQRVWAKLEEVMSSQLPTVLCLQEVSEAWAARLHVEFQRRGWHFSYAMTPMTYWKPMGVAMAWSNKLLELDEMTFLRLGAEVEAPKLRTSGILGALRRLLVSFSGGRLGGPSSALAPWRLAARKQNRLLAAKLRIRRCGTSFVAATYHMPCLFDEPVKRQAKAIHSAILQQTVVRFANGKELVLAGDFNTKAGDSELNIIQNGKLDRADVAHPPATHGLDLGSWSCTAGLRSAYAEALGHELPFTNYAWIEDQPEPFKDTLDYIFVSRAVEVLGVIEPEPIAQGISAYPSAKEPSDHVMLAADLRITKQTADG